MPEDIAGKDRHDHHEAATVLPNANKCWARKIGEIQAFGACQAPDPGECKYAIPAAMGNFCSHPDWKEFIDPQSKPNQ